MTKLWIFLGAAAICIFSGTAPAQQASKTPSAQATSAALDRVPVQRETESGRFPLVSIPPFGRGFSRHLGLSIR